MKNLFKAIQDASYEIKAVENDSRNKHGGYNYVSAEAMIGDTRHAMLKHGLTLVCTGLDVEVCDMLKPVKGGYEPAQGVRIKRRGLLVHKDGESLEVDYAWVQIFENGRPAEKAIAAAATSSLGYWLRDILLLPRADSADDFNYDGGQEPEAKPEPKDERDAFQVGDFKVYVDEWGTLENYIRSLRACEDQDQLQKAIFAHGQKVKKLSEGARAVANWEYRLSLATAEGQQDKVDRIIVDAKLIFDRVDELMEAK